MLNDWPDYSKADVTVTMDRATLNKVLIKQLSFENAAKTGLIKFTGNQAKFEELMSYLVDLNSTSGSTSSRHSKVLIASA